MKAVQKYQLILLLLLITLMLTNCKPGPENSGPGNSVTEINTDDTQAILKRDTIEIKDMKFVPAILTLNPGDTIVFINHDMVRHDITEEYKRWASPPLESGSFWDTVLTQTCDYYCSIHMVMKGKLVVQ